MLGKYSTGELDLIQEEIHTEVRGPIVAVFTVHLV